MLNKMKIKAAVITGRMLVVIAIVFASDVFAQTDDSYLFKINDTQIGGYIGVGGRMTSVNSEAAGFLDGKIVGVINEKWGVGLAYSALHYDKGLNALVNDGAYHLNAAYGGIYVERIFTLSEDFKFSISITSGMGEVFYQYDKDYRKEKVWSEEIIDKTTFAVFEPAIEFGYNFAGNYWIGIMGSFRNTSPLELIGADEQLFQKFTGGISVKYGLF